MGWLLIGGPPIDPERSWGLFFIADLSGTALGLGTATEWLRCICLLGRECCWGTTG